MTFLRLKQPFFWIVCGLLLVTAEGLFAEDVCRDLRVTVDITLRQLEEFTVQQAELNEKFKRFVEADFNTQADGVENESHHNLAVKVAFARKRLKAAVESKQLMIVAARSEYCGKCGKSVGVMERADFCGRCPASGSCGTAVK